MDTKKIVKIAAIIIPITVTLFLLGQYLMNRFLKVMLVAKLVPFFTKWEGGLSRKKTDTASANPAPWTYDGYSDWHTNRGVTYSTFVSLAPKLGYAVTPENFFNMSDEIWLKILENGYMASYPLDKISHLPRIQAVIVSWAWGSGTGGSENLLADFQRDEMGVVDANITNAEIIDNFRKKITPLNEKIWFDKLCDRREADFRKMSTFNVNGNGWLNRLADFRKTFK